MLDDLGRKTEDQLTSQALAALATVAFGLYLLAEVLFTLALPAPFVATLVVALAVAALATILRRRSRAVPAYIR
jgi:hypothetical protein